MSFNFADYVRLSIPEGVVKKITRKSDGTVLWKAGYVNMVPLSIDSSGAIYNGTGYKEGYRVRSGGAEATMSNAVCTGFIPFVYGDILRIYPYFNGSNTVNALNFYDASFGILGQRTDSGSLYGICADDSTWKEIRTNTGGCTVIDISAVSNGGDIAYVRLSHMMGEESSTIQVSSGSELIVTVNEEIT